MPDQFELTVMAHLQRRVSSKDKDNDKLLLRAFAGLSDHVQANVVCSRLIVHITNDTLSDLFYRKVNEATRTQLLNILKEKTQNVPSYRFSMKAKLTIKVQTIVTTPNGEDKQVPVPQIYIIIDYGNWIADVGVMRMNRGQTNWNGEVTFSMQDLSAEQLRKRIEAHGQPGGSSVLCWVATDKDSYVYPSDKSNTFRIWVADDKHTVQVVTLARKTVAKKATSPPPSNYLPQTNLYALLTLIQSQYRKTKNIPITQPSVKSVAKLKGLPELEILKRLNEVVGTTNNYLNGMVVAIQGTQWVQDAEDFLQFQKATKELSRSTRLASKLDEVFVLDKLSDGASVARRVERLNQAITLTVSFAELAVAFGSGDREAIMGSSVNAAFHIGMTATPITLALDTMLTVMFGGDWPRKMLGLKSGSLSSQVQVWTSHKDFVVEHFIRDSPADFKVRGGRVCTVGSDGKNQCRLHYLGFDLSMGTHQWCAVHYSGKKSLIPGLSFGDNEKNLVIVLADGEIVPIAEELTKRISKEDWISVYDAIYGTYYGKR